MSVSRQYCSLSFHWVLRITCLYRRVEPDDTNYDDTYPNVVIKFALKSSLPTASVDSPNDKQHSLSEYNKAYIPLLRLLKTVGVFEQILIGFCQHYQS